MNNVKTSGTRQGIDKIIDVLGRSAVPRHGIYVERQVWAESGSNGYSTSSMPAGDRITAVEINIRGNCHPINTTRQNRQFDDVGGSCAPPTSTAHVADVVCGRP